MVDACTAWAERNHVILAMSVLDWAGNLVESHAMEGAAFNAIDTALLKAKSALHWRRPTSETNKIVRRRTRFAMTNASPLTARRPKSLTRRIGS
jgi:uncharacterized protein GlcG (DUF336 family)